MNRAAIAVPTIFFLMTTYKRIWHFCKQCGDARPTQRSMYPLWMLPYRDLKNQTELDEATMYDYFVTDIHLEIATEQAKSFYQKFFKKTNVELWGKRLLDISGGNGNFAQWFQAEFNMIVSLTEN